MIRRTRDHNSKTRPTTPCFAKACQPAHNNPESHAHSSKTDPYMRTGELNPPDFYSSRKREIVQRTRKSAPISPYPQPLMPKDRAPKSSADHFYVHSPPIPLVASHGDLKNSTLGHKRMNLMRSDLPMNAMQEHQTDSSMHNKFPSSCSALYTEDMLE